MAKTLVDQLTEDWDPTRYSDDYRSALMKLIDQKVKSGGKELPTGGHGPKRATNVIDLASVLQQSLKEAGGSKSKPATKAAKSSKPAKSTRAKAA
jgi:DNA end-binding protein Ku